MATTRKKVATQPAIVATRKNAARPPRQRAVASGDVPPTLTPKGIEGFTVTTAVDAAQESKLGAMRDVISSMPPEESVALLRGLLRQQGIEADELPHNPDDELAKDWRDGGYPYKHLMRRATYEAQKYQLQVELLKLQAWVKETGQRVVIL